MPQPPFAVISDLHANAQALESVLADIDRRGVKTIVCLGDLVGYGADPDIVVDTVRERAALVLGGNHDWALLNRPIGFGKLAAQVIEQTKEMMEPKFYQVVGKTKERWEFLESLKPSHESGDVLFVHGSPRDPLMDYCFGDRHTLFDPSQIEAIMPKIKRVCFAGHTHFPVVIRDDAACWYPTDAEPVKRLEPDRKYFVNVGSVGQPRDGDPRSCYVLYDGSTVRFRRVDYDVESAIRRILDRDHTETGLAARLRKGK